MPIPLRFRRHSAPSRHRPRGRPDRRTAAERVCFYRQVLAAWQFLLSVKERPALERIAALTQIERTPLPAGESVADRQWREVEELFHENKAILKYGLASEEILPLDAAGYRRPAIWLRIAGFDVAGVLGFQ